MAYHLKDFVSFGFVVLMALFNPFRPRCSILHDSSLICNIFSNIFQVASIIFDFIDIWHTSADDHHCVHYCRRTERPIHRQGTISGEFSIVYTMYTCPGMYINNLIKS